MLGFSPVLLAALTSAPVLAQDEVAPVERVTGAIPSEVEAYEQSLERFRDRMNEFALDARSIVDQMEREEREKITLGYQLAIDELTGQEDSLRDLSITRFEYFLQKYPNSEYTPHVMFRLAELYFELANEEWSVAVTEYSILEASTPEDQQWNLPPEPARDYSKSIALYEQMLSDHGDYEYIDGAYYMLGYCYNEPLSQQNMEDPFAAFDKAQGYFKTLVTEYPDSLFAVDGNFILGDAYFADNEIEASIPHFEAVVTQADSDHNLYDKGLYMLAWSYYKLSDYDRTLGLFTDLLDLSDVSFQESGKDSPLKPEAVKYSAISFSDLAQRSLNFDDPDWREQEREDLVLISELFERIGLGEQSASPVEVSDAWFKTVGERGYEPEVVKSLADVLVEQAFFDDAIATYEYIQTRWPDDPENPDYQFKVAQLYLQLGIRDEEASALALTVLNERYNENSAWWAANRNNPDAQNKARRYIEQSLSQVAIETHMLARKTGDAQDYSKAADLYREYLEKFPFADDFYTIEWYLADSLYYAGRYEEAIVEYRQLLKTSGHEFRDGAEFQLFKSYYNIVEERHGTLDKLPDDAEVERTVETPGGTRNVYILSDDHKELLAAAATLRTAEFTDADFSTALADNHMALMYIPAQVLYHHGNYEEARPKLMDLVETYPQTTEGEYAASLVLNTYKNDNDLPKVLEYSQLFRTWTPPLGENPDAQPPEWRDLEEGAAFKLAKKLGDDGDFLAAAEAFESFLTDYPESENYNYALYNAANNFEKGGKSEQANQLFETYIAKYPTDEKSEGLYFRIANNYASVLELDKAISYYENLYKYFGPRRKGKDASVDAGPALYMAGFLRTGTGDYAGAAENFHEYVTQFPDADDREPVAWLEGEQWKNVGEAETLRFYSWYLREFPSDSSDHVMSALHWTAEYHQANSNDRKIEAAWKDIEENYARLATNGTMGPLARNIAAEGAFRKLQVLYDDFADDDYPRKEEDMVPFLLEQKVGEYQKLEAECLSLIQTYSDFEYSSAAIYIWGNTYLTYADLLYKAPLPKSFEGNFEAEEIWYTKMSENATPIEDKAIARFEANLKKSKNEKRSSVWIDKTVEKLNDINPSAYPLEKAEIRGAGDAAVVPSSGPMNQPEPEEDSQ
ncbi:MAG: tetratricopeptide repeat protein [Proteobacteria bacterium]|nr:tetratricopeptide repeat protein [Pseudomonadota bacterium]